MSAKRDYYDVLDLKKGASASEIKSSYRKMALKYHPDKNKAADAESKFKEINEAYQVLSDDKKKQQYDQFGHAAFDPSSGMGGGQGPFGAAGFGGGNPFSSGFSATGGFGDPFDIFEQFFGSGFSQARRRPRYGLTISFMEAVDGVSQTVKIDGKNHKVNIPAGVNDGTRIRFDNFDISINVKTHPRFKRDGYDVFIDEEINFSLAALGGQIKVKTLTGELKLKVRPGTQSHTLVRLRGEGIKHLRRRSHGDIYVRWIVKIPEKLTKEQKKVVEKMKKVGV